MTPILKQGTQKIISLKARRILPLITDSPNACTSLPEDPTARAALDIRRMHGKAFQYGEADPETALMYARKTAEAICKTVFRDKISPNIGTITLEPLLEALAKEKHLPRPILPHLRTIQLHGNFGAHDQEEHNAAITIDYIAPCMDSLQYVFKWFVESYLPPLRLKSPITVSELSHELGKRPFQLIRDLMQMNIFASINQTIEPEIATTIAWNYGRRAVF